MKKVVIYPGRFQPMLPHHASVYQKLQATFPGAEIYIATSDKVEGDKSPFNFKEKVEIMSQLHDIPVDKIIQAKSPYLIDSYTAKFDQNNTMVIFAVGSKDDDRFPMKNIDPETGLDMTVRGEPRPKYYQMINTLKQHPALPMGERGYIYNAPTIKTGDDVASASAFRQAFVNAPDDESRKEIFSKYMGNFDTNIYTLFTNKLVEHKMKEDIYNIDVMKYLAGQLNEAPINFDEPDDDEDYRPGFTQDNMINQLGKIIDSDDASKDVEAMKIKKFTPVTKVKTDDNKSYDVSPAEAKALKNMFNMLSSARQGEEQSAREKFQSTIQTGKGLLNMIDFAHQKNLVKEENIGLPTPKLDLDDIRSDYAIEEDKRDTHCSDKCCGADVKREDCTCPPSCEHCNCNAITEVAGPKDCWDGYKKDGTQPGTGKNKGKRVNKCVKEDESTNMQDMFNELRIDDNTYISDGNKELTPADVDSGFYLLGYDRDGRCFEVSKISKENAEDSISGCGEYKVADADITDFDGARYYYNDNMSDGGVLHIKSLSGVKAVSEDETGEYSYTLEYNGEENGMSKHKLSITSPEGETKEIADDFTYFDVEGDELQAELESWFHKGMGVADASVDEDLNNLRKRAGLEEKEKTEPCPKCGKTRHVLKACASCGCS